MSLKVVSCVSVSEVKALVAAGVVTVHGGDSSSMNKNIAKCSWKPRFQISKENAGLHYVRELAKAGNLYYWKSNFFYNEDEEAQTVPSVTIVAKKFNKPSSRGVKTNAVKNYYASWKKGEMTQTQIAHIVGCSQDLVSLVYKRM